VKSSISIRSGQHKRRNEKIRRRKTRVLKRLERANVNKYRRAAELNGPVFNRNNVKYELSEKVRGTKHGGVAMMLKLAERTGLIREIDQRVCLLKRHCPYRESDHVLNFAINALCGGTCLEDIELRRNDEVFLDSLGVDAIPDPTTAGDFCRRFDEGNVRRLMDAANEARLHVWQQQPDEFFDEAVVDFDGVIVGTTGKRAKKFCLMRFVTSSTSPTTAQRRSKTSCLAATIAATRKISSHNWPAVCAA
jgi:hypothetical protein